MYYIFEVFGANQQPINPQCVWQFPFLDLNPSYRFMALEGGLPKHLIN